jgi:uncharacterized protein (TIGR00369 family)
MLSSETIAQLHASFTAQGAMQALQAELKEIEHGRCLLRLRRHPGALQQHGYFHGGIVGALADSAGGYAANSVLMPSHEVLTAEYKINFLAPASGEELFSEGRVVRAGRSLVVVSVASWTMVEGKRADCALAQMTMFAVACQPRGASTTQKQ